MKYQVTEKQINNAALNGFDRGYVLGSEHGFEDAMHQMLVLSHSDFMEMTTPKDVIEHIVRLARGIKKNTFKPVVKL